MKRYENIKDEAGNKLEIFNEGLSGGIIIKDKRTGETRNVKRVFICNVPCKVIERKLGGFYVIPETEEFEIKLKASFKFLLLFLGLFSFGMVPLLLHFLAFKKYPQKVTVQGLLLKSGTSLPWNEIDSIIQNTLYDQKQAIELYPKNKQQGRLIIPLSLLKKKDLFSLFFYYLTDRNNLRVTVKEVKIFWGYFLRRR